MVGDMGKQLVERIHKECGRFLCANLRLIKNLKHVDDLVFCKRALVLVAAASSGLLLSTQAAIAGEYTPIGKTGGQYSFTDCPKPVSPTLKLDTARLGRGAVRDYNAQVAKFNSYIADVQAYMDCLSAEADRDLETYYKAVSVSLEAQQVRMQDESDKLRRVLASGPNKKRKISKPAGIPDLDGAEPVAAPSLKPTPVIQPTPGEVDSADIGQEFQDAPLTLPSSPVEQN